MKKHSDLTVIGAVFPLSRSVADAKSFLTLQRLCECVSFKGTVLTVDVSEAAVSPFGLALGGRVHDRGALRLSSPPFRHKSLYAASSACRRTVQRDCLGHLSISGGGSRRVLGPLLPCARGGRPTFLPLN